MIVTTPKEFDVVVESLKRVDARTLFLVGCGECATQAKTGGPEELESAHARFAELGYEVLGSAIPEIGCNVHAAKATLKKAGFQESEVDALVVFSCGAGVQTIADVAEIDVIPALDSAFLGTTIRAGEFEERCQTCGECILEETAGICPVTQCPKSMLNGPCGGMWDSQCEVFPDRLCVHVRIFNRKKKLEEGRAQAAQMNDTEKPIAPKNYGAAEHPGRCSVRKPRTNHAAKATTKPKTDPSAEQAK